MEAEKKERFEALQQKIELEKLRDKKGLENIGRIYPSSKNRKTFLLFLEWKKKNTENFTFLS